jgi:hypothetical protein
MMTLSDIACGSMFFLIITCLAERGQMIHGMNVLGNYEHITEPMKSENKNKNNDMILMTMLIFNEIEWEELEVIYKNKRDSKEN